MRKFQPTVDFAHWSPQIVSPERGFVILPRMSSAGLGWMKPASGACQVRLHSCRSSGQK